MVRPLPDWATALPSADAIAAVRQLVLIAQDELIAGILNRNGRPPVRSRQPLDAERVTSLRSHHRIHRRAACHPIAGTLRIGSFRSRF